MDIEIRKAELEDLLHIYNLSNKWQVEQIGEDAEKGFLSLAHDKKSLEQIILNNELIVATDNGHIVAYVLFNNFGTVPSRSSTKTIAELKEKNIISPSARVCKGGQILVDSSHQGMGIRGKLMDYFINLAKPKYDFIFNSVSLKNPKSLRLSLRDRFELVAKDDKHYYIILDIQ